jgi:four helix bundle protein
LREDATQREIWSAEPDERAAVSIPSNIAEGKGRWSDKEFTQFLCTARGSVNELLTQAKLSVRLKLLPANDVEPLLALSNEVGKMLNGMIRAFNKD